MEQLIPFIPEKLAYSLGWTIIHSIWQGSVIGVLYFFAVKSLSVYHAKLRYFLSVFALISILATSVLTFVIIHHSVTVNELAEASPGIVSNYTTAPMRADAYSESMNNSFSFILNEWLNGITMYFNKLVFIWLAGILLFTIKTAGGICLVSRYRNRKVFPVPAELAYRFDSIRKKLNIKRPVRFLISGLIDVPMAIGLLKPVILIPASVISGLPVVQLETIIVHELAHITRQDYLVNLVQAIIEILFFYHPVVWVISRQARIEREHCCDDTSVSECDNPCIYVRALASITDIGFISHVSSNALARNGKLLYHRINRILKMNKMKKIYYDKIAAGVFIITAAVVIILGTGSGTNFNHLSAKTLIDPRISSGTYTLTNQATPGNQYTVIPQDTTITVKNNKVTKTIEHSDGKTENIDMTIKDGVVQELSINGENIPEEKLDEYQELIGQTFKELNEMETELRDSRKELEGIDMNTIQYELQAECEHLQSKISAEMEHMRQELQNIQVRVPDIAVNMDSLRYEMELAMKDIQIDREKIMQEVETAMEEAKSKLGKIDLEEMREEIRNAIKDIEYIDQEKINKAIEEARQSVENIDQEKIEQEIQEALRQIEQIDVQKIQHSVQEELANISREKDNIENEKKRMDEMIREIEKLEINEKK